MQRVRRRLTRVAAVAAVGILALSACRSDPLVAAYVGDTTYTVDRVEEIYTDAQQKYEAAMREQAERGEREPSPEAVPISRQDVVNLLVSLDLGRRVAADYQIQVPDQFRAEQFVRDLRIPADAQYTQLWAEWISVYVTLTEKLPPAELTDEAILAVYDALTEAGAIQPGLSLEQIRETFGDGAFVRSISAVSAELRDAAAQSDISVNPRYLPLGMPAVVWAPQGGLYHYTLPYVDQSGPVVDLSTTGTGTSAL